MPSPRPTERSGPTLLIWVWTPTPSEPSSAPSPDLLARRCEVGMDDLAGPHGDGDGSLVGRVAGDDVGPGLGGEPVGGSARDDLVGNDLCRGCEHDVDRDPGQSRSAACPDAGPGHADD